MKANKMKFFSDLLEKNKRVFKVPVYQRNYDWSNVQCEKLFRDIMSAGERNVQHFTGTIVYMEDVNGGSGLNEVLIIDGQQRITTVYILLKALCDVVKGELARIENELTDVMFNRHCDGKYKVKLKPVKTDNKQLILLIDDKIDEMDRSSNVYKSYITFKKLIEESRDSGVEPESILEGIKQLEIVEIILDKYDGDDPQRIFESINSTGLMTADLQGNETVIDAYCETGTISLYLAQKAKHVIGIEIIPAAIENAQKNAEKNHVKNVEFHTADAADYLSQAAKKGKSADIIVLDPIRAGCSEKFIDAVSEIKPKKIVYISCNVSTLVRDIERLTQKGYTLQKVQPVDMFPETMHVETVALLSKLDVDKHIDVEIKLDELDLTSAESKATYG